MIPIYRSRAFARWLLSENESCEWKNSTFTPLNASNIKREHAIRERATEERYECPVHIESQQSWKFRCAQPPFSLHFYSSRNSEKYVYCFQVHARSQINVYAVYHRQRCRRLSVECEYEISVESRWFVGAPRISKHINMSNNKWAQTLAERIPNSIPQLAVQLFFVFCFVEKLMRSTQWDEKLPNFFLVFS